MPGEEGGGGGLKRGAFTKRESDIVHTHNIYIYVLWFIVVHGRDIPTATHCGTGGYSIHVGLEHVRLIHTLHTAVGGDIYQVYIIFN